MNSPTVRARAAGTALILSAGLALSACTADAHLTGNTSADIAACPSSPIASTNAIDLSGSFQSDTVKTTAMDAVSLEVSRVAICGGHVRVFAFASSTGATAMLYDGDLQVDAPTENARLRKAGKLADDITAVISEQYDAALASITGNGSDPLGMLSLLAQSNAMYPEYTLVNQLVTDGVITIGIDPTGVPDPEAARDLADQQAVPSLAGADVSIVGIGKQGTGELPSAVITNLTAFWEQVCTNTGAAACHVSTEGR